MLQAGKVTGRVLHVVGHLGRGGVETWLLQVMRVAVPQGWRFDFLVHTDQPSAYDADVRALGGQIIACSESARRPWRYARALRRVLEQYGPYDIVHSHVHHFSGMVLREAQRSGVGQRIAHSHIDTRSVDRTASLARRLYLHTMARWIGQYATVGFAASGEAGESLYGQGWRADARWQVLYCGIDLRPFTAVVDRAAVRAELGLPAHAFVVGHVGRFDPQKNHEFLVEVAAAIARNRGDMRLLLVGDGARRRIEAKARAEGLLDKLVCVGARGDVPRLMLGAMDVFVLPSLYEGLPLVMLEAQAAGLPCVVSDRVSREAEAVPELIRWLSLADPPSRWGAVVCSASAGATSREEALHRIERSAFNVEASAASLLGVYRSTMGSGSSTSGRNGR